MGRCHAVRGELRLPRASGAMALHRPDAGGPEADGGQMKGGRRMDIGVALLLDLTLRRRRPSHAYFPRDEGSAGLRACHARFLPWPLAFGCPHGRVGGSPEFWRRSLFPFCGRGVQPTGLCGEIWRLAQWVAPAL